MVCYVRCDNYTFNVNSYNRNYDSHVIIGGPQLKFYHVSHVTRLKLCKKAPKSEKLSLGQLKIWAVVYQRSKTEFPISIVLFSHYL